MPNEMMPENKDFHIHVLSDGNFVLTSNGDDYGYEDVEELLSALRDDLTAGGKEEKDEETVSKKDKVKKIMEDENEDSK